MCGRYYRTSDKQQIAEALRAPATPRPSSFGPLTVGFAAQKQATATTL